MLLVVLVCAPSNAEAGCGHYAISSEDRMLLKSIAGLDLLDDASGRNLADLPFEPREPLPCSGPSCSQGQRVPVIPATIAPLRFEPLCEANPLAIVRSAGLSDPIAESSLIRPLRRVDSIERPPRLS